MQLVDESEIPDDPNENIKVKPKPSSKKVDLVALCEEIYLKNKTVGVPVTALSKEYGRSVSAIRRLMRLYRKLHGISLPAPVSPVDEESKSKIFQAIRDNVPIRRIAKTFNLSPITILKYKSRMDKA